MQRRWQQFLAVTLLTTAVAASAQAQMDKSNPMVGGMAMMANRDIVDNAVNSPDHTTLVAAVKAAGLVDALKAKGPLTVFAPTNAAFGLLPEGTVANLLKPENKALLTGVLTYHVVAGRWDAKALMDLIKQGHGTGVLTTVNGAKLWVMMNGERNIVVKDGKGTVADISVYDVYQSNGVILVVDKVLMPA
ncbi:MAG TPA: fasciclin domain-containing protein [Gemmatimonadales bacterium]|nr:fasciclin domain-containing protein [Gemmatimonadales bacterium]